MFSVYGLVKSIQRRLMQSVVFEKYLVLIASLCLTCLLSFVVRLFSVVRYESVIHEFDPYFNYRSTEFLAKNGLFEFINYFDSTSWYPLGRAVGPTLYPGLMVTAYLIHSLINGIGLTISVKDVCVFVSPLFSAFTVIACYSLAEEVGQRGSGLFAGFIISILPAYISRSVAGSYDNEGIAIFAMVLTYLCWARAMRSGSILNASMTALAYFYMVSSWGGYVFIINLIPIHVLIVLVYQGFTSETYIAYSVFYCVGTLLSMQIPFVGFQAIRSSEHMGALGVFGLLQIVGAYHYLKGFLGSEIMIRIVKKFMIAMISLTTLIGVCLALLGVVSPWTGRFYSLLDPSYAKNYIPIIASVAEHQSTAWSSLFNDFFISLFCVPLGLYFCIYHTITE